MASTEDVLKLIAKTEGEAELARLQAALSLATQKYGAMFEQLGKGHAATKAAAAEVVDLGSKLGKTGGNAGKAAQFMTQAGYAADDLQYGFKGISNNIQPVLSQIPSLAGLAGPLAIAAIAAFQLYEHWDQVMGLFNLGIPQPALTGVEKLSADLKKATDEMEELSKKTRLEWYELDKLNKLRQEVKDLTEKSEAEKAVKSATDTRSDSEKASGEGFGKAVAESGGKDAFDEFKSQLGDQADAKGLVYNEAKARMTSVDEAARDMFAAALKGDKISRDAIAKALGRKSGFGGNIRKFSPEAKEAEEAEARQADRLNAELDQGEAAKEADRKKREEQTERMREAEEQAAQDIKDAEARDRKEALDKAEKATAGTALDSRLDDALLRSSLKAGGQTGVASKEVAEQLSKELQAKGLTKGEADSAAGDMVAKEAAKLSDDVNERAMNPRELDAPDRIASVDFARSVESAGAAQGEKLQGSVDAMKEKLADMLREIQRGARLIK